MGTIFTSEEIESYLLYIGLSKDEFASDIPRDFNLLRKFHQAQIATVPYENLDLHYHPLRTINIDQRNMYNKVLSGRGRGGQCMEINLLAVEMIKGLGFQAYSTGCRNRVRVDGEPVGGYLGLSHILTIVIDQNGDKYAMDAGFGGESPTLPLRLKENDSQINLGTQEIRLIKEPVGQLKELFWHFQVRHNPEKDWNTFYIFNESEYFFNDFIVMNHYTSTHPMSWHVSGIYIVKLFRDPESGIFNRKLSLAQDVLKENTGGRSKLLKILITEEERFQVLQELFLMKFTQEEKDAINGSVARLKGVAFVP